MNFRTFCNSSALSICN